MGDRRGRQQARAGRGPAAARSDRSGGADRPLWGLAHPDGVHPAGARRPVRGRRHECGASTGDRGVRPFASPVVAFSSGAQDRRTDARSRARPQRDRDHHSHLDADRSPNGGRIRAGRRRDADLVRLALCRRDQRNGGRVSGLYDARHQLAHRHPAFDERERHRRQHQGDRQPAQLRDGEIFWRRRPRSPAATTRRWRGTST